MVARNRLGDRRECARFDVAGRLWAALDLSADAVLRNLGLGGALVEATLAPGLRSIRAAQMSLCAQGPVLNVVVRHVSPISSAPEEDRYLVGLEFIHINATLRSEVEQLVREWNEQGEG